MSKEVDQQQAKVYGKFVQQRAPKSRKALHTLRAFWVGGLICVIGQCVSDIGKLWLKLPKDSQSAFTAIVMVFLGATLTGIGIYDRIGKYAGAGSIVPITGFANSVAAPAIEFKAEGYVMGTAAKLFTLAGPVLVNGYAISVVCGLIKYVIDKIGGGG
jgi:stage V sporulation protein AC